MPIKQILMERSGAKCELCSATDALEVLEVTPSDGSADQSILVCATCGSQIKEEVELNTNHWRCLNDSMWSQVPAVQVMAWRMLKRLSFETWAIDLFDMLYLDDESLKWAEAGLVDDDVEPTKDSNGATLKDGDSVTLIKDLNVKGGGFTAKRGTLVKNISLTSNPLHIEGKVNGTTIVLVSAYLKKA